MIILALFLVLIIIALACYYAKKYINIFATAMLQARRQAQDSAV